jgi:hypothetical protein
VTNFFFNSGPAQNPPVADPVQLEGSGTEPLDLNSPLNDTSIHVRASATNEDGAAVEILTKKV